MSAPTATVVLPSQLSLDERRQLEALLAEVQRSRTELRTGRLVFDFSALQFVEPDGLAALAGLIGSLRKESFVVDGWGLDGRFAAIEYLHDCGFVDTYFASCARNFAFSRRTTFEFRQLTHSESHGWISNDLMPWMATSLGRNTASLAEVKVCVQEVFNNIQDHSTEVIGCVVGQYYPKLDRIDLAISDFGIGIPRALQSYFPDSSDADLVMRATEQGITSKPNGRNQGQGLSLLIDNIVGRFGGYVRILSGRGLVRCVPGQDGSVEKTTSSLSSYYPGALVRIRLFAQNLPSDGPEVEELDW